MRARPCGARLAAGGSPRIGPSHRVPSPQTRGRAYLLAVTDALAAAPAWAQALLWEERVARLGLLDDAGEPRVLPIVFAMAERAIWSAIDDKPKRRPDREPARLRYLRSNPAVAFTVDRYVEDWRRLAWVQVLGRAVVVDAGEARPALEALTAKYAQYRESPPPGPLVRIDPARLLCWRAA